MKSGYEASQMEGGGGDDRPNLVCVSQSARRKPASGCARRPWSEPGRRHQSEPARRRRWKADGRSALFTAARARLLQSVGRRARAGTRNQKTIGFTSKRSVLKRSKRTRSKWTSVSSLPSMGSKHWLEPSFVLSILRMRRKNSARGAIFLAEPQASFLEGSKSNLHPNSSHPFFQENGHNYREPVQICYFNPDLHCSSSLPRSMLEVEWKPYLIFPVLEVILSLFQKNSLLIEFLDLTLTIRTPSVLLDLTHSTLVQCRL